MRAAARDRLAVARGRVPAGGATVALGALAFFASGPGQSFFLSGFVDPLIAGTGITRTSFSLLYALATVVSAVMVLQVGRAIDRFGGRAVWIAVTTGLAAACLTLSVAAGVLVVLLALSFMRGFGQGSFPLLGTVLVAGRFERRRGSAIGLATQGITLAAVALPPLAVALIDGFGWRAALRIVAVGLIVLVLPFGLSIRRRPRAPATVHTGGARIAQTVRRPGVAPLLAILAVTPLVSTAFVVHATSLLSAHGLGKGEAALALSLMAVTTALGALAAGVIADRAAPRVLLALIGAVTMLATLLLLTSAGPLAYLAFAGLGYANGTYAATNGTVWAGAYGTADLGRLQGLAASAQIAGAAAGPLPLAIAHSLSGGYASGVLLMAALAAAALVAGWRWRPPAAQPV